MTTVSCIIPVFNGERFIGEAIASVRAQEGNRVQLIVVDDGSTDSTREVVKAIDSEVLLLTQPNAGACAARNHGMRFAKGDFIAFLDADDRWLPSKITQQLSRFSAEPRTGVVLTRVGLFWEEGLETEEDIYRRTRRDESAGLAGSSMLVRRSAFDAVGEFRDDLRHFCIVDWFERAKNEGVEVAEISTVLVERRMHSNNSSRLERKSSNGEMLQLIKSSLDRRRAGSQVTDVKQ